MSKARARGGFRPLRPAPSLTENLIERLSAEITSGRLAPSERLPTEQEMIASFGVSRTVVREAVAALKAEGLVETRQGSGVFVSRAPRRPFRIETEDARTVGDVLSLMELRVPVEVESAGLAADRRRAAQLRAITRGLRAFERAVEAGDTAVDADFRFHCAIAEATGNPYYVSFLRYLGSFIIPRRTIHVPDLGDDARRAYLRGVLAEHRTIRDAIERGDAPAARDAMRLHLTRGRDHYRDLDPGLVVE